MIDDLPHMGTSRRDFRFLSEAMGVASEKGGFSDEHLGKTNRLGIFMDILYISILSSRINNSHHQL